MKKHLPKPTDMAIFGTLALILAAISTTTNAAAAVLAVLACPLFFVCAIYGMHRSGRFAAQQVVAEVRRDVPAVRGSGR